tara:strand:+ start:25 stop:246 length:222 start_codon:yes stop_codon:yes gene_type:complete
VKNDQQQIEFMYEKLLDFAEKHKDDIEVPNMCRVLAMFLCELCYDLSPSGNHASHLILSAMITKMEQKIDKGH